MAPRMNEADEMVELNFKTTAFSLLQLKPLSVDPDSLVPIATLDLISCIKPRTVV